MISLKVGFIKECSKHPDADKLYVSKISVREDGYTEEAGTAAEEEGKDDKLLTVVSGLVNYLPVEEMINHRVVLVTNLKPSKMRGVKSEAMVLAGESSSGDGEPVVKLVRPPKDAQIGQALYFQSAPREEPKRLKPKDWEYLQQGLKTDSEGRVVYVEREPVASEADVASEAGEASESVRQLLLTTETGSECATCELANASVR